MGGKVPVGLKVEALRPTQMTVGLREVEAKRQRWRDADKVERSHMLRRHLIPAVIGPKHRVHIVDHHHFARALLEEDAGKVGVYVLADLSSLSGSAFWTFLDNSHWCHAYDAEGRRCALDAIPHHLRDLADDPYRSLVGALIRKGGCAKSDKPFAEFLWADHLRRHIEMAWLEDRFEKGLERALTLAREESARYLPGWCGVRSDGL